jgi:hypothetical protein
MSPMFRTIHCCSRRQKRLAIRGSRGVITYHQDGTPFSEAELAELEKKREKFHCETFILGHQAIDAISDSNTKDALKCISTFSLRLNSEHRLPNLLTVWEEAPPSVFWKSFTRQWPGCDDTWDWLPDLLWIMRRYREYAPSRKFLGRTLQVYRGCTSDRVLGISWTTNRKVAEKFAYGHRGIRNPNPVIATAMIPPSGIFLRTNDRDEREVILDPELLRDIQIESFSGIDPFESARTNETPIFVA